MISEEVGSGMGSKVLRAGRAGWYTLHSVPSFQGKAISTLFSAVVASMSSWELPVRLSTNAQCIQSG